jgi:FAD/FMN-containing dehydrogenase
MDARREYEAKRARLVAELAAARARGGRIGLRKSTSNLFRRRSSGGKIYVDVRDFNRVLCVDRDALVAHVEGMTTYETLVEETLRHGLLPMVVPQLKTITLGGAVSGLGIESSSFKFGLVHESVEEMEILLGSGDLVTCSPEHQPDLFYGFPNSYGTLGYALRLAIRLLPAGPYVQLTHTRFTEPEPYFTCIAETCNQGAADYVDGTVFSRGEMYLTRGDFAGTAPQVSDYTYMDIYYRSIQRKAEDWLTTKDYIWRWDTDWFWCSKHFYVQHPAVRRLAKWALNSRTYQKIMRLSQRWLPDSGATESVIQDVDIPIENAAAFLCFLLKEIGILPIWICPFQVPLAGRAYDLNPLKPGKLHINFGFWDVIPTTHERGYYNRKIEVRALELGGAKGLYSTSYYDRDTFWRIYDKPRYDQLKQQYDPEGSFGDLYAKCVLRK